MMLYLAAPHPLPLVELTGEDAVGLVVAPLSQENECVRGHFDTPHVYFVSTHDGCACTFGSPPRATNHRVIDRVLGFLFPRLIRSGKLSQSAGYIATCQLKEYLTRNVTCQGFVLYSCWAGDEDSPPDPDLTMELSLPGFFSELDSHGLAERQMVRLL